MRKSVLLSSFAVVSFSVLGIENIPNFGNYPSHSSERTRVKVDVETTHPSNHQDQTYLLQQSVNSVQTYLDSYQDIPLNGTNLQKSNIDFSLNTNMSKDAYALQDSRNSLNPATEKQETSGSQNTDRKGKRKAEESKDVQEFAKKIRREDQNFRDPNAATSSQSAVTEETSSLISNQKIGNQHTFASPTASPTIFTENQQNISEEKLKEMLKLPEYPEGYEEKFLEAIETDFNIDKATAKDILVNWRALELEAFGSVNGLTEEKLNEWRNFPKTFAQKNDNIYKDLLTKIREKKRKLYYEYRGLSAKDNIYKLIEYHDFMLIRFDDLCSFYYNMAINCNNSTSTYSKAISWLKNHKLAEKINITDEERENIISQIIEGKQFEEIQEIYPKLSKRVYDGYMYYTTYWFRFSEQNLFKKKINGNELDKKLKPFAFEKITLDTNALADLIKFRRSNFIEQYKDYDYYYYRKIAAVWKVLAAKNFEKPNWCNEDTIPAEQRLETSKRRGESGTITKKAIRNARDYLKSIDEDLPGRGGNRLRPDKQQNVISFYKWKLDEYERLNTDPKKSIRGTKSEFTKNAVYEEVQKYFDLNYKDIQRIFDPYRVRTQKLQKLKVTDKEEYNRILNEKRREYQAISAENIASDVNTVVQEYEDKKYNILDVLKDIRSGKEVDPEVRSESQKIVRYLWKIGFSYERIIELLGLKDDFANYCSTARAE